MARRWQAWLFLGPLLVVMGGLLGYPLLSDIYLSLSSVTLSTLRQPLNFVGLANYLAVLGDHRFWEALGFSLKFAVIATSLELVLGLAISLFFWHQFRSANRLVSLMLLALMTAPALLATMVRLMLNDFVGVVPAYMQLLGMTPVPFLGPQYVVPTLIAIDALQWVPFCFLLLYTGLQGIPSDLLEAAAVDSASTWQTVIYVILPQLLPSIVATGFLRFIDTFRIFDIIYVLTGGGPGTQTTSISIYIYKHAFVSGNLGLAIAAAMILLGISLVPVAAVLRRAFVTREGTA